MSRNIPAPLLRRYTADAIDAAIVLTVVALVATATIVAVGFGVLALTLIVLAGPVVDGVYRVPMMMRAGERNGQTLGRELLSVRVVMIDGSQVTSGDALIREVVWKAIVLGTLSSFLLGIPTLLDLLSPLWHPQQRAWHDQLSGTMVVDSRAPALPPLPPTGSPQPDPERVPAPPAGTPLAFDPPTAPPPHQPPLASPPPPQPPPPGPQPLPLPPPQPNQPKRRTGAIAVALLAAIAALVAGGAYATTQLLDDSDPDPLELTPSDWYGEPEGSDASGAGDVEEDGEGETPIADLSNDEMREEIDDRLRAHHSAIASGEYREAWETLSNRKRQQYLQEGDGYSTWRDNQSTLSAYIDPADLGVEILSVNETDGVATVRVTGMGWSGPGATCTEWSGITWVKFERGDWYYDPGYSTTSARERTWKPRFGKLLGASC